MLVPKPFSRLVVRYGTPFQVVAGSDERALGQQLEAGLNDMERWAEDLNRD
jgi:lysophospholipid acyltransferase (LPLAT)-like uncharacterized protein